jgi:hypothetical protein
MKTIWLILVMMVTGCATAKDFYVQENSVLGSVTVHECSTMTFRNIDTGKAAKRKVCRDVIMDGKQKEAWKDMRKDGDGRTPDADSEDTEY